MSKKEEFIPLEEQLIFPLYLCSKEVTRKYNTILEKFDLTYTQFIIMMYFWEKKTSNVKKLSETMLLDSSTLTPLLKKLEKKGYITRNKSLLDERNLQVELTKEGMALKDQAYIVPEKMKDACKLSDKEVEELRKLLYKLLVNIEEESKE